MVRIVKILLVEENRFLLLFIIFKKLETQLSRYRPFKYLTNGQACFYEICKLLDPNSPI